MTVIRFAPGLKPVLKHVAHDQSSHGNWADGITLGRMRLDPTNEDDVRKAFTGTLDTRAGKVSVVVDSVDVYSSETTATGSLIGPDGKKVGTWSRKIMPDVKVMYNDGLYVTRKKNLGIATEFQKHSEQAALAMGMDTIQIKARMDGIEAWATERFGFEFAGPPGEGLHRTSFRLREQGRNADADALDEFTNRFDGPKDTWPRPSEVMKFAEDAAVVTGYGGSGGMTIGKTVMSYGWNGEKPADRVTKQSGLGMFYVTVESSYGVDGFVMKHEQHDQSTHGNWATGTINAAWDSVLTDEAKVLAGKSEREALYPERYTPGRGSVINLKSGEIETRIVDLNPNKELAVGTPPRVQDYQPFADAGLTQNESWDVPGAVEMMESRLVPVGPPRPPQHVYRVMSVGEFEQAKNRGYIKSDERMNLGSDEGTVTSLRSTGSFYQPVDGSDYRVVRIKYDDADGWLRDRDGYIKTSEAVPFEQVDSVSPVVAGSGNLKKHGQHDQKTHGNWAHGSNTLTPTNLNGAETVKFQGSEDWADLEPSTDNSNNAAMEMAGSMVLQRIDKQFWGKTLVGEEQIIEYTDDVLKRSGYGDRVIAPHEDDGILGKNTEAAVAPALTKSLPANHPLYGADVPSLIYRKEGISEFVLLHEIAHIMEGSWKSPQNSGGHNNAWWDTWGALLANQPDMGRARSAVQAFGYQFGSGGVVK